MRVLLAGAIARPLVRRLDVVDDEPIALRDWLPPSVRTGFTSVSP